jgi:membrane-associated protease RseP (regulator of RpoE activity)
MSTLFIILVFAALVLVHELGHFVAARLSGVGVRAVALGWGRILWMHRLASGLELRLCLLPLGGYCKIKNRKNSEPELSPADGQYYWEEDLFEFASLPRQVFVLMGGLLANVLAATLVQLTYNLVTDHCHVDALPWALRLGNVATEIISALVFPAVETVSTMVTTLQLLVTHPLAVLSTAKGPLGIFAMGTAAVSAPTAAAVAETVTKFFISVNVLLAGFNLVPLAPLDGGLAVSRLLARLIGEQPAAWFSRVTAAALALVLAVAAWHDLTWLWHHFGTANCLLVTTLLALLTIRHYLKVWKARRAARAAGEEVVA